MSKTFITADLGQSYKHLLELVMGSGEDVAPRGMNIKELRPFTLELHDPQRSVVSRPGFSEAYMYMEIAQLLAGTFDKRLFEAVSPSAAALLTEYGAYGPRISQQLEYVVRELRNDPDSRRAVAYVGRPDDLRLANDCGPVCTESFQFFIRNEKLECHVNMRSWDLVWGLSYDVPCFASVQLAVANDLLLQAGTLTIVAGSGHIYEKHFDLEVKQFTRVLPNLASTGLFASRRCADEALRAFSHGLNAPDGLNSLRMPMNWAAAILPWEKAILKDKERQEELHKRYSAP